MHAWFTNPAAKTKSIRTIARVGTRSRQRNQASHSLTGQIILGRKRGDTNNQSCNFFRHAISSLLETILSVRHTQAQHITTQHNPAGRRFPPRPRLSKAVADMWTNPATGPTSRASPGQKPEAPPPLNLKAGWSEVKTGAQLPPKTNGPTNHRVPDTSGHARRDSSALFNCTCVAPRAHGRRCSWGPGHRCVRRHR